MKIVLIAVGLGLLVLFVLGSFTMPPSTPSSVQTNPPPSPSVAVPTAATRTNCHEMFPTQPILEQACIQRWTVGTSMPGPSATQEWEHERTHGDWVDRLTYGCAQEAGFTRSHAITPSEFRAFTACADRQLGRTR